MPDSLFEMGRHLRGLSYQDKPNYKMLMGKIGGDLRRLKVNLTDDWEWERAPAKEAVSSRLAPSPVERNALRDADKASAKRRES